MPKSSPTIYEVARHAGVSIATVSRVQRGHAQVAVATRMRVAQSIAELAYRPSPNARALAADRHEATGIVFPNLSGPYYSEVIYGFEREAVQARQSVLILGTHGREGGEELVHDLAGRVDGLVILGRTIPDRVVEALGRQGMPVVLLARSAVAGADTVRAENRQAARELVEHLFGHGRNDLAFVGDPDASPDVSERWTGFLEAHRLAHRPPPRNPLVSGVMQAPEARADTTTPASLRSLLDAQRAAFRAEGAASAQVRADRLQRCIDMLVDHEKELCDAAAA